MERLTGVVLERDGRHIVLLTPLGEFKRVRISGRLPDIGEEVCIPVAHRRFFKMPKSGWIAVAAAVLLLLVGNPLLTMVTKPPEAAMAYVSIDIKPSIELTVSDRYNVMDALALNADGQRVLNGIELKGVKYTDAVDRIKNKASQLGYINSKNANTVLVSVAFLNDSKVDKALAERTLVASANSVFADSDLKVAAVNVPKDFRDTAQKKGISTGKYAVLIEAVNSGLPLTEKDMQEKPVNDAIAGAGGQPQQIINQAGEETQFDVQEKKYIALASQASNEQQTVASAETPDQSPPALAAASDAGLKPGSGIDTSGKTGKERKYVETIRKSGSPEETKGKNENNGGISPAGLPNQPPAKTGNGAVSVPSKDTTATVVYDQKTVDNYMGTDQSSNNDSTGFSVSNDMYKLKPNW